MTRPIYLDYAATTPVDPRVVVQMNQCMTLEGDFGNPASSSHCFGWQAEERVETARCQLAALISARPREIIWTSGATESDNLAIQGVAQHYRNEKRHIITVATEHKAVLDPCRHLQKQGWLVTYLQPQANGLLNPQDLKDALTPQTALVSIMHVNNETGVIQDIMTLGQIVHEGGALFHVDAAQSLGKLPVDVRAWPVDLLSFSAHKMYGPKGVGALFLRQKPEVCLQPLQFGGGHEQGLRSGTLATHQIVGMGTACVLALTEISSEAQRLDVLRVRLLDELMSLGGIFLNGHDSACAPHIVNVAIEGVKSEALLQALEGIAFSTGSACNSDATAPSHVLTALGGEEHLAHNSIRLSIGRFTTDTEISSVVQQFKQQIVRLRRLSGARLEDLT